MRGPWAALLLLLIIGCSDPRPQPRSDLNGLLRQAGSRRDPALGQRWLASLTQRGGRERIELIDLRNRKPVPLPGLNRADGQPIDVSVSADGERLAVVEQRQGRTELLLYRRSQAAVQRIPIEPAGVPRAVSLDAQGKRLAVQISRDGRWQVDLIRLP
ncbi:hypothetical protein [Synechococcus sp. CC9616]|uniref:TolB family protein n=1 Tax=Synechococcus sp. CC9616 TaxID=110663 RepID=UPI000491F75C|nr:hypothetical protein [Synechococcus sp. CC9616]